MPYTSILVGPVTIYVASEGAAKPNVEDTPPSATWSELGESLYSEDGVQVQYNQTFNEEMIDAETAPVEVFRSTVEDMITVTVKDLSMAMLSRALNGVAIATSAPSATVVGRQTLNPARDNLVTKYSALIRGRSPADRDFPSQMYWPRVYVSSNAEMTFTKSTAAMIPVTFKRLHHPTINPAVDIQNLAQTA